MDIQSSPHFQVSSLSTTFLLSEPIRRQRSRKSVGMVHVVQTSGTLEG